MRPDAGGIKGQPIQVVANVFKATMPKGSVHLGDVTIVHVGARVPAAPKIGQKGVVLKNPMKPAVNKYAYSLSSNT